MSEPDNILVIRHGALGDIVLSTGPFAAIRRHHPESRIVLLTTAPYAGLLRQSPYFDEVWIDAKPGWRSPLKFLRQMWKLNERPFSFVYDLQTSQRSSFYHSQFRPPPNWSGIAKGASHRHSNPERKNLHTLDRQRDQLKVAGIEDVPPPDLSWLTSDISRFDLPADYALLVPGGSAHRPEKRWPVEHYAKLADSLLKKGVTPVLLGSAAEAEILRSLEENERVINLGGKTDFADLVSLARQARFAVGNDTGPMHLIAAAGCRSVVLFSAASNPSLCAPRGDHVTVVRRNDLKELPADHVLEVLDKDFSEYPAAPPGDSG